MRSEFLAKKSGRSEEVSACTRTISHESNECKYALAHYALTAEAVDALLEGCGLGGAAVVISPLDGGPAVRLRPEAPLYPASMIKVPIAMAVARLAGAGTLRWEDPAAVHPRNVTPNDAPSPFAAGYKTTLGALVTAMISRSDNVATNVLIDAVGRELLTFAAREMGLSRTSVRRKLTGALPLIDDPAACGRNVHPASDAALLFERLARFTTPWERPVLEALEAQYWNDKLSRGWDAGDAFAHKTGDTDECSHDGGILTLAGGRRYVVVVYTGLPSNAGTDARFAAFARALRPLLDAA